MGWVGSRRWPWSRIFRNRQDKGSGWMRCAMVVAQGYLLSPRTGTLELRELVLTSRRRSLVFPQSCGWLDGSREDRLFPASGIRDFSWAKCCASPFHHQTVDIPGRRSCDDSERTWDSHGLAECSENIPSSSTWKVASAHDGSETRQYARWSQRTSVFFYDKRSDWRSGKYHSSCALRRPMSR